MTETNRHDRRIMVDGVEFASVFRFPKVLRSVTSAMQPPRLVIALLMVVALVAVGRAWDAATDPVISARGLLADDAAAEVIAEDQLFLRQVMAAHGLDRPDADAVLTPPAVLERLGGAPAVTPGGADTATRESLRARLEALQPIGAYEATASAAIASVHQMVRGVLFLRPQMIYAAGRDLFVGVPVRLWSETRGFAIGYGLFLVIILSLGGGAICRMAACEFAGQERLRVRDAVDFALGNWVKLIVTPLLPLLIATLVAGVLIALGVMLLPWLDVLGGILYGLALLLGFVLAFLLLGYGAAAPLLLPAIACENCDAADAQQRAYAYLLSRPLHLLGYGLVAIAGLALGYVVIGLVASALLNLTAGLLGVVTDNTALAAAGGFSIFELSPADTPVDHATGHSAFAAAAIGFWQRVVVDLAAAYVISYVFTSTTIVYLLMRRVCDGQDVEEIWRPGLTPGTLVPLPRPAVEEAAEEA
ncbi:MAG: hypothetical protein HKO59_14330 [Phycisphaerales bacterium]|nr:hypothetical protein [Phycisphaerae bacterium]NNF44797.1 hypothetical protein [Phycisphaerales bacterium]NNM27137.1 hypothetical protein [Phycisphaerales bacterium]